LQVLHFGGVVELGVGAGWSKTQPSVSMFDEGSNHVDSVWDEDWSLHDVLSHLEHVFHRGESCSYLLSAVGKKAADFDPETSTAVHFDDSRLPHLTKWIRKLRPVRYAQIGQRPTEPFLSLHKGNPRGTSYGRKPTLEWSYPRKPRALHSPLGPVRMLGQGGPTFSSGASCRPAAKRRRRRKILGHQGTAPRMSTQLGR
jgi:hypothetical protein